MNNNNSKKIDIDFLINTLSSDNIKLNNDNDLNTNKIKTLLID